MINMHEAHNKEVHRWANGKPISLDRLFSVGDNLKNVAKGRSLAIIAPSHLLKDILNTQEYSDLINSDKIDKMTVNRGIFLPGINKYQWYLPFTTRGTTNSVNKNPDYIKALQEFPGIAMHGMYTKDSVNPYILASQEEVKYVIQKCPNTKFAVWRHCWGEYLRSGTMAHRMCEFPHYEKWTPSKIPWAHCGAISGFAIPLAMTLGYSKIYLVCMGYNNILNSTCPPLIPAKEDQNTIRSQSAIRGRGMWVSNAPRRFKNQAILAKTRKIILKVGPKDIIEKPLLSYFQPFETLSSIING